MIGIENEKRYKLHILYVCIELDSRFNKNVSTLCKKSKVRRTANLLYEEPE